MTNFQSTKEFFARVFPWEQNPAVASGYLNIHWTNTKHKGLPGRATTTLDGAINAVKWLLGLPDTKDIYFCTSAQAEFDDVKSKAADPSKAARRSSANALRLKALFVDLDAKGTDKNSYPDQPSALRALVTFLGNTGLPRPNIVVNSGGGFHCYWTMATPLTRAEWQPLADALAEATRQHGLKTDTACTVDAARVLRVPETSNHKTIPARPVQVLGQMLDDYSVERITKSLTPYLGKNTTVVALPALSTNKTVAAAINAELSAGITNSVGPIDRAGLMRVAKSCAFVRDTMLTGGLHNQNPLWHQSVLIASFLEQGDQLAHIFSKGHPSYTPAETTREFDRVTNDVEKRGLGWPSCKAIANAGCTACASCAHFAKGKSPLNLSFAPIGASPAGALGLVGAASPQGANASPGQAGGSGTTFNDLPPGYKRRPNGVVVRVVILEDGSTMDSLFCDGAMMNPELQSDPWTLSFDTIIANRTKRVSITTAELASMDFRKTLQGQGFMVQAKSMPTLGEFMTSWVQHLQATKAQITATTPYGWEEDLMSNIRGFVYGGVQYNIDGTEQASAAIDEVMARQYTPKGNRQVWIDAARMTTEQGRPQLDAIVASAFAAPLVRFTGQSGLMFSNYSAESGIGKSTTMAVALAVWSRPNQSKQGLNDTENMLFNKIGKLRNLPMYWDELRGDDPKKYVSSIFRLTEGREKGRLTAKIQQREVGNWETILVSAGNDPLMDLVQASTPTTQAGIYRLFEANIPPAPFNGTDMTTVQRLTASLNSNYGWIGQEYAKYLVANYKTINAEVESYAQALGAEVGINANQSSPERFWLALMTTILLGAKYANAMGVTTFNLERLKQYMIDTLAVMRVEVKKATVDVSNPNHVSDMLQRFVSTMQMRNTIYTNKIWTLPGRPTMGMIQLLKPTDGLNGIWVQVAVDDKVMRISAEKLDTWMLEKHIPRKVFIGALEKQFNMVRRLGHLGGGTGLSTMQQYVYDISLIGALESMLDGL